MSFTIKYRYCTLSAAQDSNSLPRYDTCEQLHGPYEFVSRSWEDGHVVIRAYTQLDIGDPRMTFGPHITDEGAPQPPRPVAYVMNAAGATVAKYEL